MLISYIYFNIIEKGEKEMKAMRMYATIFFMLGFMLSTNTVMEAAASGPGGPHRKGSRLGRMDTIVAKAKDQFKEMGFEGGILTKLVEDFKKQIESIPAQQVITPKIIDAAKEKVLGAQLAEESVVSKPMTSPRHPAVSAYTPRTLPERRPLGQATAGTAAYVESRPQQLVPATKALEKSLTRVQSQNELKQLLINAVLNNNPQAVEDVINKGANVDVIVDDFGRTALMYAVGSSNYESVQITKMLINAGAKLEATDRNGLTALMHACTGYFEAPAAIDTLIKAGANVNAVSPDGRLTPLKLAVSHGHTGTVRQLIVAGADTKFVDNEGRSIFDLAQRLGNADIVRILIEASSPSRQK